MPEPKEVTFFTEESEGKATDRTGDEPGKGTYQ